MSKHEIVVGNVGTVYSGVDSFRARQEYFAYVKISKTGNGRAGGEQVTWFKDGDIHKEHEGVYNV